MTTLEKIRGELEHERAEAVRKKTDPTDEELLEKFDEFAGEGRRADRCPVPVAAKDPAGGPTRPRRSRISSPSRRPCRAAWAKMLAGRAGAFFW